MEYIEVTSKPPEDSQPITLVIGKFDGVHRGHVMLLQKALDYRDGMLAVMSFSDHPNWILRNNIEYKRSLTPLMQKIALLQNLGAERFYNIHFTQKYAQIPARDFVIHYLSRLNIKRLVVGEGFYLGKGRESDTNDLIGYCKEINIAVSVIPLLKDNDEKISSATIRSHIKEGRIDAAGKLLGRHYVVAGEVIHGNALGRELGFPTINLGHGAEQYAPPKAGVYAGSAEICHSPNESEHRHALISAGYRPTVDGGDYLIEANLLDFSGDVYGKKVNLSFYSYLREELKFNNLEELVKQMKLDELQARAYFQMHHTEQAISNISKF
ncbi:riboflavin biosynthesis protein RibF [Paenibacillus agaridevorans]|uniref:riboflavin biosynthesis protein RibF n=1 Tax=Paenibacillus agaridevorans TaxID=171404 RepID=UPI001BE46FD6|nr:riboflavin biosynthesis protein RibF [Paenibacillus agaridevorans]